MMASTSKVDLVQADATGAELGSTIEDTMQSQLETVYLRFVLNVGYSPETCPSVMLAAFQQCEDQGLDAEWMKQEDLLSVQDASKKDIFVVEPFEGGAFEHVQNLGHTKCVRLIGPRCLTYCLLHKLPLPDYLYPMHNMAMHNIVVTCTGFDKAEKEQIKKLVQFMAGVYSNDFHQSITHLIAGSVGTNKYKVALAKEVPVMQASWVQAVWAAMGGTSSGGPPAAGGLMAATDQKFLLSHVCPVFLKQVVCVSQMPKKDKLALQKLIEVNGGVYSATLDMDHTTLLVLLSTEGEKYSHAVRWKIPCVTTEYIYDSVQAGYALDVEKYKLKRKASTPTKQSGKMLPPDVSMVSAINVTVSGAGPGSSHIDETMAGENTFLAARPSRQAGAGITNDTMVAGVTALDHLSLSDVGQCGLFLDGCKVYLSGWAAPGAAAGARVEKLRKLLNLGGATRFNQLTDAVSHVVMGSFQGDTVSTVTKWCSKPHLVSASWLIESLQLKRPADEAAFSCVELSNDADGDDASNTVLPPRRRQRVSETANDTTIDFHNRENDRNSSNVGGARTGSPASFGGAGEEEDDLVKQYMKAANGGAGGADQGSNSTLRNDSINASTVLSSQASQAIFRGLSFLISGYESEILSELEESLSRSGARVLTTRNYDPHTPVDYCLLTQDGQGFLAPRAKHYVTHVFAEECYEEERVVPVQFYHLPLLVPLERCPPPLEGVVLAMSTYTGREKHFLVHLTNLLGAKFQEMFARKDNSSKGVLRCTHLICPSGAGDKYRASVKWSTPALTRDWLLAAGRDWALPDEAAFAAKDSGSQQELPALQIIRDLLDEHISSNMLWVPEQLNDSTMIAPTPVVSNKVLSLRAMGGVTPSIRGGRPGTFTTPGKPTTPSAVHTPDMDTLRGLYPTPGRAVTTNDSLDAMPTPETPYGRTWEPNPSARTRKAHKRLLENLPENNYERVAKFLKKQEDVTLEQSKQMAASIVAVLGYDPNESGTEGEGFTKQAKVDCQGNATNTRQGPLKDCVLYVSKKFENIQSDLHAKVKELGGQFRWSYDATVTHYIFGGKTMDKEVKIAKEAGKSIVFPEWVTTCYDRRVWVDESSYPYCQNPNMSLTVVSERRSLSRASSSKKPTDNPFAKRSTNLDGSYLDGLQSEAGPTAGYTFGEYDDVTNLDTDLTAKGLANVAAMQPLTEGAAGGLGHKAANAYVIEETVENTQVARELEELEQLAANSETQSQNFNSVGSKGATPVTLLQRNRNSVGGSGQSRRRSVRRRRSEDRDDDPGGMRDVGEPITTVGTMELPGGSQMTNIAWADPMDREARAKLSSAVDDNGTDEATLQENEDNDATQPFELPNETDCEQIPEEEQPPPAPRLQFVISNVEGDERDQLVAVIVSLGGVVLDDVTPAMTHLITTRPTRSEKHLTAIAAGKWVLPPLYLWQCHEAGAFIEESAYEWGDPENSARLPSVGLKETEIKLAAAAHRWRVTLSKSGGKRRGAFSGWRVLVATTADRAAAFVRLLEAGGGAVHTEGDLLDSTVAKSTCSCHGVALNFCPDSDRRASSAFNTTQRRISGSNFPRDLTHCFVEMKRNPKFDLALFAQHQVPCMEPMFINNHLLSESPLDPHHCCVPLYKEIVSNLTKKPALMPK